MISSPKNVTVALSLALALVIGLLLAAAPIAPQSTPAAQSPPVPQNPVPPTPQAPSNGGIRTTVELVVVPVTVKDSRGGLVSDLRQDEFRVLEDGVEQRISVFSVEAVPLSAVVLVDDDLKTKTSAPS